MYGGPIHARLIVSWGKFHAPMGVIHFCGLYVRVSDFGGSSLRESWQLLAEFLCLGSMPASASVDARTVPCAFP
jgi:hypothetical protein